MTTEEWKNKLYFGDNLAILRDHIDDESVDLIYLDPPFNSKATYNVLFKDKDGADSTAQIAAFDDTWHWGIESEDAYHEVVTSGGKLADLLSALRQFLGTNDMMAYLTMMAIRLKELHRVLKPTGSIYLHCDPTASHYLKLVLDAIFGQENYKNEVIWKRANAHNDPQRYGRITDRLLYYAKTKGCSWNTLHTPYRNAYYESHFKKDDSGRWYRTVPLDAPRHGEGSPALLYEWKGKLPAATRTWAIRREKMEEYEKEGRLRYTRTGTPTLLQYADEMAGVPLQDIWTDIPPVNPQARERLGYPTQKPEALLERIIEASCNEGDIVLDPFCGCGTAIAVAERLHRRWIGIDITHLSIALMKHRLHDSFAEELSPYEVVGDPKDLAGARALAEQDRYQFEWWALSLVEAQPAQDKKKGADKGIDGLIYFIDNADGKLERILVQVKSGHVQRAQTSDLCYALDREDAAIGLFITLEKPSRPMIEEAATAGFYEATELGKKYPRCQILTIEELLDGKQAQYPRGAGRLTYKQAKRRSKKREEQPALFDDAE